MTAALVATYVDDGPIGWDQRCIDAWSGFRAPTDEMTRRLRVRDLLGMASGLGEPRVDVPALRWSDRRGAAAVPGQPSGDREPGRQTFFYNNTLYAVGGYLPLLATGVAPGDLLGRIREGDARPALRAGRHDRCADRRRPARPRRRLRHRQRVRPAAPGHDAALRPDGSHAPAGGALASLKRHGGLGAAAAASGLSVDGGRVVSRRQPRRVLEPHVTTPTARSSTRTPSRPATPWAGSGRSTRTAPRWCGTTGRSTGSRPTWPSCRSTTSAWSCSTA